MRFGGLRGLAKAVGHLGFDPDRTVKSVAGVPRFLRDLRAYEAAWSQGQPFPIDVRALAPIVTETTDPAGGAKGDYFHQDLWAARRIFRKRPSRHLDVGSRIDGFIAHLLCFMDVQVVDIRPLRSAVAGLEFVQADATRLDRFASDSVESLSSLHAVEHFGLGRYGDPVDPDAWRRAALELSRVLAPGGTLYFSVPVGVERLVFNAHRVFDPRRILDTFADLKLTAFAAVDDGGGLVDPAQPPDFVAARRSCGLFEFTKP